ncbi:MAG: insulinase family protein [Bacteroidales bacterium]|nr:insulinase family protein [Bacteroidales bacterium]
MNRTQAPAVREFGKLTIPEAVVEKLPNGITLHIISGGEQPVCSLAIFLPGGIAEEGEILPKIMLDTMADAAGEFKAGELGELLDFNGVRIGSAVYGHWSTLKVSMLNHRAEAVLPLVKSILVEPLFPEDRIEVTKTTTKVRLETSLHNVATVGDRLFDRIMLGEHHPLARNPKPGDVDAFTREDVVALHRRLINTEGMHVFVMGQLDESLLGQVRTVFGSLASLGEGLAGRTEPYAPAGAGIYTEQGPATMQDAVVAGIPTITRDNPDYIPLRLTVMALGGYFGSRLMANIREEKGLTYGIYAYLAGAAEGAYVKIFAQCDKAYTVTVIEEIKNELTRLAENPPEGEELAALKLHATSSLAETLDTPMTIGGYYSAQLTAGTPDDYFTAQQEAIAALTSADIARLARTYLNPEQLRIGIVGN